MASFEVVGKSKRVLWFGLVTVATIGGLCFGSIESVQAARVRGTSVEARICDGVTGASITITTPPSDTVVTQPTATISGSVQNATQIEERINGQYNGTIPLNANATTFETTVTLPVGTSTIELVAIDVCGTSDGTDTIVITYAPPPEPENPGETPEPSPPQNPEDISGDPTAPLSPSPTTPLDFFERTWRDITRALDFDPGSSASSWKNPIRASFLVAGIGLALLASYIVGWLISLRTRRLGSIVYTRESSTSKHWLTKKRLITGLRALGFVLIILTFII